MVRAVDVPLQCVSFLGRIFCEVSLTFGASSSPSIFHRISEIILVIAVVLAVIKKSHTLKQLDDVIGFGSYQTVRRFHRTYDEVCANIGVRLAPDSDPSKRFSCTQVLLSQQQFKITQVTNTGHCQ